MSRDYKNQILSQLLDWYESSPAYLRNEAPGQRRIMRLYDNGKTDFPAYDIENHILRKDINQAVLVLAELGIIGFEWMQGQREHIIARVWLISDRLHEAYSCANRQPKHVQADTVVLQLRKMSASLSEPWAIDWVQEQIESVTRKRAIGNSLPTDESELADLFRTIAALDKRSEAETLERVFSIHFFGDSKRFEHAVRTRLIRILKKHFAQEDDMTDESVLRLVGLTRAPEQFEFSGKLTLALPQGEIDFSLLPYGATITSEDVNAGELICNINTRRVMSIENKANYIDYVRKNQSDNELVIYHGGQYSPAKRIFFQKLCAALPKDCSIFHWGDIDFGGFSMLGRLRREIFCNVQPWRMGIPELEEYSQYCKGFEKNYAKKLSTLLTLPELDDCADCIKYMLRHAVRLEQEAMLI